jgi:phosphomannomutase/phosphoglucomutase
MRQKAAVVEPDLAVGNLPRKLFGTSGIRGSVDDFLTPEFCVRAGLSFAALLENEGTVLVGRDVRLSSQVIQNAVMSGLSAGGIDTVDCGIVPTPAMLFALKKLRDSGGVMVTGSHTPPPTNGLLFFLADTGEMDERGEGRLEEFFRSGRLRREPWNQLGRISTLGIIETYAEQVQKEIGDIGGYRVVVDPGNGATCATLGPVLEKLGCEVVTINGQPDGTFPSRSPYPQPSTLGQLSSAVKEAKADIGVGTDSDGDRAIFATENGRVLWGDKTCAIFVKNELEKQGRGRIVTTVNTSNLIRHICREYGAPLTVTKVGPPAIAEALRSFDDAIFAAEESGKYIWPQILMYGDAALATGNLLQIMKSEHKSLEELEAELPSFHQFKSTIACPDELKARALQVALQMWDKKNVEISTVDGLKVDYPNNSSFLLRASGTEPALRCYSESQDEDEARELMNIVSALARDAISKAKEE